MYSKCKRMVGLLLICVLALGVSAAAFETQIEPRDNWHDYTGELPADTCLRPQNGVYILESDCDTLQFLSVHHWFRMVQKGLLIDLRDLVHIGAMVRDHIFNARKLRADVLH